MDDETKQTFPACDHAAPYALRYRSKRANALRVVVSIDDPMKLYTFPWLSIPDAESLRTALDQAIDAAKTLQSEIERDVNVAGNQTKIGGSGNVQIAPSSLGANRQTQIGGSNNTQVIK